MFLLFKCRKAFPGSQKENNSASHEGCLCRRGSVRCVQDGGSLESDLSRPLLLSLRPRAINRRDVAPTTQRNPEVSSRCDAIRWHKKRTESAQRLGVDRTSEQEAGAVMKRRGANRGKWTSTGTTNCRARDPSPNYLLSLYWIPRLLMIH